MLAGAGLLNGNGGSEANNGGGGGEKDSGSI